MRKILLLLFFLLIASIVLAIPSEDIQLTTFVQDYSNTLTQEETQIISQYGEALYNQDLAQYAIVIVDSLEGKDLQSYALDIAQDKLGDETNNGLLLLISIEDKKYRFEVGRGLEPIFNDAKVGRYGRDYLVPNFQSGNYSNGIGLTSQAIYAELTGDASLVPIATQQTNDVKFPVIGALIIFIIIYLVSLTSMKRKGEKLRSEDYFMAALLAASMLGRGGKGGSGGSFGGGGNFSGGGAGGSW
jgi:uncharacterized protein